MRRISFRAWWVPCPPLARRSVKRRADAAFAAIVLLLCPLAAGALEAQGVVNINTATADELELLPRVGPALAERIIQFRDDNGNFKSTEELILVRGIGERTYELLKPYVTVEGATTLEEKVPSSRPDAGGGE